MCSWRASIIAGPHLRIKLLGMEQSVSQRQALLRAPKHTERTGLCRTRRTDCRCARELQNGAFDDDVEGNPTDKPAVVSVSVA